MKKEILLINKVECGETIEKHGIAPDHMRSILKSSPHFGWHLVNDQYKIKRDDMNSFLLIMTVNGSGALHINGKSYMAVKDQLSIIPPSVPHSYYASLGSSWEFYWIHISPENSEDFLNYFIQKCGYQFTVPNIIKICSHIEFLLESHKFGLDSQIYISRIISRLLYDILEYITLNVNVKFDNDTNIKNTLQYIHEHYTEQISIEDISSYICLSPGHTIKNFKKYTGYTPYAYLKMYRLMKACEQLTDTSDSVKKIALDVGYKSTSHFISEFKAEKNSTPSQYRKKYGYH